MRVREARAAFKTWSARLPHEKRIKLQQKYASQGFFNFKSRTAQVLSSVVSTDSNLLMLFLFIQVWEFAPSGQSYVRLLAIFLLNVHANSAWTISLSLSVITPGTCFVDRSCSFSFIRFHVSMHMHVLDTFT